MALRPVSELGLVDLTDLAAPTARRRTDGGTPKRSSRASERSHAKPRAKTSRAVAEKLGISVTCVVAGAAGVLLGRAAIRS